MKYYVIGEDKCLVEAYTKEDIDKSVKLITVQRYYSSWTGNPELSIQLNNLPNDFYDSLGMPNYIVVGGYVGTYKNNGDVISGYYNINDKYSFSYEKSGIVGSLQDFTILAGYTLDAAIEIKKVRNLG